MEFNKTYLGNSAELIKELESNSIDLTVTSPPYSDLRTYGGTLSNDTWNSKVFESIASELYRVTKDRGVVVWVVNDKTENGNKTLVSFKQALYFQSIGFNVNDVMIWSKPNYMPSVKQPRYSDCFEYMFVFSKGFPKTFNPLKEKCKCAGMVYDSTCKNIDAESGRTHKTFNINDEKTKSNIWNIAVAQNKTIHPAVFPEQIARDHILSWTNEGDVVLDPFLGSGTTAIVAKELRRKYIGFEISEEYFNLSNERIKKVLVTNGLY